MYAQPFAQEALDRTNDNILVQLMKAADSETSSFALSFADHTHIHIDDCEAQVLLKQMYKMKSTDRLNVMVRLQQSRLSFMKELAALSARVV